MTPTHFEGPGLLVMGDVISPYAWSERIGPTLMAAAGFDPSETLAPSLMGPNSLVVALDGLALGLVDTWRASVMAAEHVVFLVCPDPESADDDLALAEHIAEELGHVRVVLPWGGPADVDGLKRALRLALQYHAPRRIADVASTVQPALPQTDWHEIALEAHEIYDLQAQLSTVATGLAPDGRLFRCSAGCLDLETGVVRRQPNPPGYQTDPWRPISWLGGRCRYTWRLNAHRWTHSEHDWPLGHGKKLWGYKSNDSMRWELHPQGDAMLSHYEHDVMLTGGLPLRWQRCGVFSVAVRFADPLRALFYEVAEEWDPQDEPGSMFDPAVADDEDGRGAAPVVALGVNADLQYAVALEEPVWRILGEAAEPLPTGGWAIFNRAHQVVQRLPGVLLGGSAGCFFSLLHGVVWRIDALTGAAEATSIALQAPFPAVPVQTAPNLILIDAARGEGRIRVRRI